MPKRKPGETSKSVEALPHPEATRKHIPTAEHEAVMEQDDRDPIPVAYRRRNRDLDPQLVWRGKDEQDASGLVVQALPLFIQEKVHAKILVDGLRHQSKQARVEEVPCRCGSGSRRYRPDFVVSLDDGNGDDDPLHVVVEIKGYRGEDAKDKKATMDTCWVPGVNNLRVCGRWAFAEFAEVH